MKALFITALIVASLFLGYDFFLAPPHERMIFEKGRASATDLSALTSPITRHSPSTPALRSRCWGCALT